MDTSTTNILMNKINANTVNNHLPEFCSFPDLFGVVRGGS